MTTYSNQCTTHLASMAVNLAAVAVLAITLSSLAVPALAGDRANMAIDACIDKAVEEYGVERSKARFWQMNQVGRYVRVWLKVSEDEGRTKALCKVRKGGSETVEIKTLNVQHD